MFDSTLGGHRPHRVPVAVRAAKEYLTERARVQLSAPHR